MTSKNPMDYSPIGGRYNGDTNKALRRLSEIYVQFELGYHKQVRNLVAIAYDIGTRLIEDKNEWEKFCRMKRWASRKYRPQDGNSSADLMDFVALAAFSTESGENDDRAKKYGRSMSYFLKKGLQATDVVEFIESTQGKLEGVYKLAVKEDPRRTTGKAKETFSNDDSTKSTDAKSSESETEATETEVEEDGQHKELEKTEVSAELQSDHPTEKKIIYLECANDKQFHGLMHLEDGERVSLTVKCKGPKKSWRTFKLVKVRRQ